jgi:hypothetical protein
VEVNNHLVSLSFEQLCEEKEKRRWHHEGKGFLSFSGLG